MSISCSHGTPPRGLSPPPSLPTQQPPVASEDGPSQQCRCKSCPFQTILAEIFPRLVGKMNTSGCYAVHPFEGRHNGSPSSRTVGRRRIGVDGRVHPATGGDGGGCGGDGRCSRGTTHLYGAGDNSGGRVDDGAGVAPNQCGLCFGVLGSGF